MWYLLDENKEPYEVTLEESLIAFQDPAMKILQQDTLPNGKFVSTVFLSLDHGWDINPNHKPVLFETIIFDDREDERRDMYQERYTSYADALAGHQRALEIANKTD